MSLVTRVRNTRRSSRSTGDASDGQATENRLAVPPRRRPRADPGGGSPVSSKDDDANARSRAKTLGVAGVGPRPSATDRLARAENRPPPTTGTRQPGVPPPLIQEPPQPSCDAPVRGLRATRDSIFNRP